MATRHETEYENITFSFTVREQNFASHFEWNGVRMVTPWHQTYFKVIIKVYDEKTNWTSRHSFYIPLADWETKDVIRENVLQVIYQKVRFPETINGKSSAEVFHDSVRELNDAIRDFYSEEKYDGIKNV